MINAKIPQPRSPGAWVDDEKCICGEIYKDFRPGYTFTEARDALKELNLRIMGHDGFKSRMVVLTMMRSFKLEAWYCRHHLCGT